MLRVTWMEDKRGEYTKLWLDEFQVHDAARYHAKFERPEKRYKHEIQLAVINQWICPGLCLEAPIGSGRITQAMSHCGDFRFMGLDLSQSFLKFCNRYGLPLMQSDLHFLPISSGTIDTIICLHTLMGLPRFRDVLKEFMRVLRRGGRLIVDLPSAEWTSSRLYHRAKGEYPYGTQLYHSELPDVFPNGVILAHYKHDWVGGISNFHPKLRKLIKLLLRTGMYSWLRNWELKQMELPLLQSFCMKHLLVIEKEYHLCEKSVL